MTPGDRPLAGLDFALVGPGRVGSSLALWAVARGASCLSVAGRGGSPAAAELARRLGASVADSAEPAHAEARLVLVAVPDGSIAEVARRLASRRRPGGSGRAAIVLHTSGALGGSALAPLTAAGHRIGSFHPLRAFPAVEPDPARAAGTFFALDGDPEARALGRRLAEAFGGEAAVVSEESRPLYHWAATLAAGGVVTLLATARSAGRRLGLPDAALRGYGRLAEGALAAAIASGEPAGAITGPAARGDRETVEHQLALLRAAMPDFVPLALELARATLARCAENGTLGAAQASLAERLAELPAARPEDRAADPAAGRSSRADLLDPAKDRVLTSPRSEAT